MSRPRLDVRHLAMLEAISRIGSISGAARHLGRTQPALSRQLQEAERRLGLELLHRDGKGIRLTVAGETILQCARRVLSDLADSERRAAQIPEDPFVPLRISLGNYDDYGWFPAFYEALGDQDPALNLSIVNTGEADPQEALDNREIDLAIVAGPIDKRHFLARPLFEDELVAVARPEHAFASQPYLNAEHFSDQVYATFGATYHMGFESDRVLLPADVWPRRVVTIGSTSAILDLVQSGAAITVLSAWVADKRRYDGRVITRSVTRQGLPIGWSALVRRSDGPNAPSLRLARHLQQWCGGTSRRFASGL